MSRRRVVVAGLGDSGVLTAIHLARHCEVVGISVKPGLVSGQELGLRISRPDAWARDYRVDFERFRGLDRVRTIHGTLTGLDIGGQRVTITDPDGSTAIEDYDALVISTGVTNGFWRRPTVQTSADIDDELRQAHDIVARARSVIVVGGGAAAVSSAANIAARWPRTRVDLYYPGERALPQHHPRTWRRVGDRLDDLGVNRHPGYRALLPNGFECDRITGGVVRWTTGQMPAEADAVVWAIGRTRPNTDWLPAEILDGDGFVRVDSRLSVPGCPGVFAVGDVAATDRLRSSARNRADRLVAHNVRAHLDGRRLKSYRPKDHRWGSVLGPQPDGLEVFAPTGYAFRFPAWSIDRVLQPWIVRRGIYHGVRDTH
ncbi:FAD-dependent oxidoreductase [Nocardia sp. 348MFTsu5.1]|uniref:FAD-dependent oxidoreductase n=1 Tax=Nocardia sp. 348MFTsu5.1 TaxID=1172185 RepID=UPI000490D622|nr:FAD-dependent oxidoreductase [Nocardia sp. 348MFTsu5.1]